tara:strand:+ start:453 stop:587 length:135 start_codon:yes stop_codon:yes gene_type:complete
MFITLMPFKITYKGHYDVNSVKNAVKIDLFVEIYAYRKNIDYQP